LSIELAAARTKALSVQEIARRIDDRFGLLSDPTSRRPERYRALATAIAWSYDLLFPDEQRGLYALACFSGGAPVAAAEGVVGTLGFPPRRPSTSSAGSRTAHSSPSISAPPAPSDTG
jgi:predicted ATPase